MFYRKEIISQDGLSRQYWEFQMFENLQFVLNAYSTGVKESKRHKNYQILDRYERLSNRSSNITENEIQIPEIILHEIRELINNKLSVIKWSQYKR